MMFAWPHRREEVLVSSNIPSYTACLSFDPSRFGKEDFDAMPESPDSILTVCSNQEGPPPLSTDDVLCDMPIS